VLVGPTTQAAQNPPDAVVAGDYDACGSVDSPTEWSDQITLASMAVDVWSTWTLNSTGLAAISKTAYTLIGLREKYDVEDTAIGAAEENEVLFYSRESANDPYLRITYRLKAALSRAGHYGTALFKNVASQKIAVYAWDEASGEPKTGDAANITAQISLDGGVSAATNDANPTELDATDHPGTYLFDLLQAETNASLVIITPVSSTSNIVLAPLYAFTNPVTPTKAGYIDASIQTVDTAVDAILIDTAEIGVAGAGLSNIPWNSSWDAEVESECTDALNAYDPPTRTEATADKDEIISDLQTVIHKGTADAGSTANSLELQNTASASNDIYNENLVVISGGTGVGQARLIADYIGGTKTIIVRNAWRITPDHTSEYRIYPFSGILLSDTGIVVGASASTITFAATAPAIADILVGHTVYISGGTGVGQARLITEYTAGRVATISPAWDVQPVAASSVYLIIPIGQVRVNSIFADAITATSLNANAVAEIADGIWNESKVGHTGDLKTMADNLDQSLSTTESNIRGADSDDLKVISDQIDGLNDLSSAQVAAAVIAATIEGTLDLQEVLRILLSFVAGKVSGASESPGTINYRDQADTKNRLSQIISDIYGNRSSVTVDGS
jgi:hypothetical protein